MKNPSKAFINHNVDCNIYYYIIEIKYCVYYCYLMDLN